MPVEGGRVEAFDELERQIQEEMKQIYTEVTLEHAMNPRNVGSLPQADGFGQATGSCGDTMQIWLKVKDGRIDKATFWTDGCGTSIACGSMVTELIKGKTIAEAFRLSSQDILNALGGLPEPDVHCSVLAASTLKEALKDYLKFRNEEWKRAYQRKD